MADESVLIFFPVSCFGWMPVLTTMTAWEEIYEAYQDEILAELDDDNQAIEIDLCDSVKGATVVPNPSDDMIIMASGFQTHSFFAKICLDLDQNGWRLHYEVQRKVIPLFIERGGETEDLRAISLGTIRFVGYLNGDEIKITLKAVDEKTQCEVARKGSKSIEAYGDDYIQRITEYLDGIEPKKLPLEEQGVTQTLHDKTAGIDLAGFDDAFD